MGGISISHPPAKGRQTMKTTNKRPLWVCPDCLEAIQSHGEKIILCDYAIEKRVCDWCDEKTPVAYEIWFRED